MKKFKNEEDYDFIKFKKRMLELQEVKECEIDIFYEYTLDKLRSFKLHNLASVIMNRDKSIEIYDIAIDISMSLRKKSDNNPKYIPTLNHVYRLLIDFARTNKVLRLKVSHIDIDFINEGLATENINDAKLMILDWLKEHVDKRDIKIFNLYLNKYTYKEIGIECNISHTYVNKRINHIINIIKNEGYNNI